MPGIIAFDVNETLLDLSVLDSRFQSIFGDAGIRRDWFEQVLKLAFASTIVGSYSDFGAIGRAALLVVEERLRKSLSEEQRLDILQSMRRLPAHPDVKEGFKRLRERSWRLVALTNSTLEAAEVQLKNADLRDDLERVFSADSVRRLKPAAEAYHMAARELGIRTSDLLFVAAHSWDIAGAAKAGCRTAFLARPGQVLDQLTPKPAFIAADLDDLVDQLTRARRALV